MEIRGRGVDALQLRFLLDWNYATKGDLRPGPAYFPIDKGTGGAYVQIVSGGPDNFWNPIKEEYLKIIGMAKRTVYLQTPYFVPDQSVLDALRMAALSGVDVRIMFPCKPDHPFVYWASYSYIGKLLDAGGEGRARQRFHTCKDRHGGRHGVVDRYGQLGHPKFQIELRDQCGHL